MSGYERLSNKVVRSGSHLGWWCPACGRLHIVPIEGAFRWNWNGDATRSTLTPSVKHTWTPRSGVSKVCHYFITNGRIEFCSDCTHALAGKVVELPELPAEIGASE